MSLSLKYNIVFDENIVSLTIVPSEGHPFTKAVLSGYSISYTTAKNTYEIKILNTDNVQKTIDLLINSSE
jgi:hypothetical protein